MIHGTLGSMKSSFPPSCFPVQDARTLAQFRALGTAKPQQRVRRDDRCCVCGKIVGPKQLGYADLKTGRVWCRRPCRPVWS